MPPVFYCKSCGQPTAEGVERCEECTIAWEEGGGPAGLLPPMDVGRLDADGYDPEEEDEWGQWAND